VINPSGGCPESILLGGTPKVPQAAIRQQRAATRTHVVDFMNFRDGGAALVRTGPGLLSYAYGVGDTVSVNEAVGVEASGVDVGNSVGLPVGVSKTRIIVCPSDDV
jgi:hypothetical protein